MITIIAPHADDELIGCYRMIKNEMVTGVIYVDQMPRERVNEAFRFCNDFNLDPYFACGNIGQLYDHLYDIDTEAIAIPSMYDDHILHKLIYSLVFYSRLLSRTIYVYSAYMNDSFIEPLESKAMEEKLMLLDKYYPSQKDLWKNENKFFIFEGVTVLCQSM